MAPLQLLGEGFVRAVSQLAVIGGTAVLLLLILALGSFAYKQIWGEGVTWPDEDDGDDETLQRGDSDDEWKFY
ncbi:MAG: hypothetical protein ABEK02_06910 [Haloquadratum sp.]